MSNNLLVSRKSLQVEAENKISEGKMKNQRMVAFSKPVLGAKYADMSQQQKFDAIDGMTDVSMITSKFNPTVEMSGKYDSGFDIPAKWSDGKMMSVRDKIATGAFSASMSSNTLPVDWTNLWDAMRIDVTVRKAALPTIREFIYNITKDPNFTRTLNPTEINSFGIIFEENNGHGQAVPQGETMGGGYDSFTILIYAAGFTWDLMASLFDRTITPERVMDAVMIGYNSLRDDLAISPILDFSYAGVQQTAASAVGTLRQELLYNTFVDAIDDLGDREHPVTERDLDVNNVVILAHPFDARHIVQVISGLPSVNQIKYPALSEISKVIAYDDEVINLRSSSTTYSGVTKGTAYMIIPASSLGKGGHMEIAVKADLTVEVDEQPDVSTLSQKQTAYWYAEGIWTDGIQYFIQEITLPTW